MSRGKTFSQGPNIQYPTRNFQSRRKKEAGPPKHCPTTPEFAYVKHSPPLHPPPEDWTRTRPESCRFSVGCRKNFTLHGGKHFRTTPPGTTRIYLTIKLKLNNLAPVSILSPNREFSRNLYSEHTVTQGKTLNPNQSHTKRPIKPNKRR